MVPPDRPEPRNIPTPVPVHFRSDSGPIHQLNAMLHHSLMRRFPGMLCERPRCVCDDEDLVALFDETQRRERDADFCQDTAVAG